jgi:phenylacetate-CoA ligase
MMAAEDGTADGFRVWSDLFFIEVVDPQTGRQLPDGEVGALVVTPLFTNTITPFLRWVSGDMVSVRQEAAGNGPFAVFPVLRHAHRTSGFVKVRGININHGELEDFMFRLPEVNDFKGEVVTDGALDQLPTCAWSSVAARMRPIRSRRSNGRCARSSRSRRRW